MVDIKIILRRSFTISPLLVSLLLLTESLDVVDSERAARAIVDSAEESDDNFDKAFLAPVVEAVHGAVGDRLVTVVILVADDFVLVVDLEIAVNVINITDVTCLTNASIGVDVEAIHSFCEWVVILDKVNPEAEVMVVLRLPDDSEVLVTGTSVTVEK